MNNRIEKVFKLADASAKRFEPEKLNWQWGQALYIYGLALIDSEFNEDKYTDYIKRYYDYHIGKGYRVNTSDTAAPALGAFYLAGKTKEQKYIDVVNRVRKYFDEAPKVVEDMPNHLGSGIESYIYPSSIWIDSLMMYGVFTSWYAKVNDDKKLMEFAMKQPRLFAKYLLDSDENLFYHSYWTKLKTHYPVKKYFWGRGNGWVMAAIPLFIENFDEGEDKEYTIELFKKLSGALLKYQRPDGYFETVFNKIGKTYTESSATMLIASGWFYGYKRGWLSVEYYRAAVKAFNAVVDEFEIKDGLLSMPKISAPTSAIPLMPYFAYKITPRGNDWHYGLAAAFFAALQYKRCLEQNGEL
ncbi:MAG: glycoside hydrolase family 88 protein [Christensenellales bacterium]|jgi:unsaturated rhamnogalacturonyl hydrolase